jgi:ABC-type antimicrobial peptide transport system permease subunit
MSETFFPINDLIRRKLQTLLVMAGLALCTASTIFLLGFSRKMGFGIEAAAGVRLTAGLSIVLLNILAFLGLLVVTVSAVIMAFFVYVMMSQRARDIGLMKAVGCPNNLVFGYFVNELLIVGLVGCSVGAVAGIIADYASSYLLSSLGFIVTQGQVNLFLALIVFLAFLGLSVGAGIKPLRDVTKIEPARAVSPSYCLGLTKESDFRGSTRGGLAFRIAFRSLFRRKSASLRIILCLTAVFLLVTVAIAGGIIADQTSSSWVEGAVGRNVALVAHADMASQYKLLLSKFYDAQRASDFNYTSENYSLPMDFVDHIKSLPDAHVETRLVLETQVEEIVGYRTEPGTLATRTVGSNRTGISLIEGVVPNETLSNWLVDGAFLKNETSFSAVVGDSLGDSMFEEPQNQSIRLLGHNFAISGVCIDPVNNGNVTFVPLRILENITAGAPNVALVQFSSSGNRAADVNQLRAYVESFSPNFTIVELDEELNKQIGLIGFIWSSVMFVPLFVLAAASLCLVGYAVLTINEQRQELGILRAVGAKPFMIVEIIGLQNLLVLLASYSAGVALGIIVTLLILVSEPVVTSSSVLQIAAWLLVAFAVTFVLGLYPAVRFARKTVLEIMSRS